MPKYCLKNMEVTAMYIFTIYCFFFLLPTKVEGYYIELVIAHSFSNLQNTIYVESKFY